VAFRWFRQTSKRKSCLPAGGRSATVETGLSSDPPMNWRLSMLDRYRLVSNSDAHSPAKLGREATTRNLERDWVLVHELVHHAMPNLADEHHWMEEGLATYVEPIARAQAGELTAQTVWGDLVEGLPKGLPRENDRGLDRTPTWGRTYWGGALFYLLADIDIRRRTDNKSGLQDALRALVAAGGNISESWPVERVIEAADRGTHTHALADLYDRMKETPVAVDLPALWRELGVAVADGRVTFDDGAPLAAVRRAITAPR